MNLSSLDRHLFLANIPRGKTVEETINSILESLQQERDNRNAIAFRE